MAIAIVLRMSESTNLFRDAVINSLSYGDEVILCSGFFQENFKGGKYQATLEPKLIKNLVTHQIRLTTIGIHNSTWRQSYKNFRDNLLKNKVNITCLYKPACKWHAKVFILKKSGRPIFGIIGSSNITANAFGVSGSSDSKNNSATLPANFNYECDVFFWVDKLKNINRSLSDLLFNQAQSLNVFRAQYNPKSNFEINISQRLQNLMTSVLDDDLKELD